MSEAFDIVKACVKGLDDKKGLDIKVIKVDDITILCDYFVICNGTSATQVKTLCDNVEYEVEKIGHKAIHREGMSSGGWILIDFGSVIVHVFMEKQREFYKMERMWADGIEIDISQMINK